MGDTVKANDNKATKEHTAIRSEIIESVHKVRTELMGEIKSIRLEQRVMRKETNESFTKVLVAIEKIKK